MVNFRWARQHEDYGTSTFNIASGDVVADAGELRFDSRKLYDPLEPPIGSCFIFVADPNLRKGMEIRFDSQDKVVVRLPEDVFNELNLISSRPELQISLVVFPALMETLAFIRNNTLTDDENLDDRDWFRALWTMIEAHGGIGESPLRLAQKILANPIDNVLKKGIVNDVEDDG